MDPITFLIVYSLSLYFVFFVWARSELLRRPREWILRNVPQPIAYMLMCPLCLTFHIGWILTLWWWLFNGELTVSSLLLSAPAPIVLLLDLAVRALTRYVEPPFVTVPSHATSNTTTATVTGCSVVINPLDHEQTK